MTEGLKSGIGFNPEKLCEVAQLFYRSLKQVEEWTIQNMQDDDGFFYYRIYPCLKAKNADASLGSGNDLSGVGPSPSQVGK
jgi:hypothetical protein